MEKESQNSEEDEGRAGEKEGRQGKALLRDWSRGKAGEDEGEAREVSEH